MRKAFIVYVDLDERPGVFHTDEEAKYALGVILNRAIPHYKPEVSLAPLNFQQIDLVDLKQFKQAVRDDPKVYETPNMFNSMVDLDVPLANWEKELLQNKALSQRIADDAEKCCDAPHANIVEQEG